MQDENPIMPATSAPEPVAPAPAAEPEPTTPESGEESDDSAAPEPGK